MSNPDKVTAKAYAGLFAAASAVAAKRAIRRPPGPGVIPRGIRLPRIQDTPHLFEETHDSPDPDHKLARIAAASLLYTVEKKPGGYAERLLRPEERDVLRAVHRERDRGPKKKDTRCRYCHLSSALYNRSLYANAAGGYDPHASQKFVVVRHSATVKPSFDPETYVSSARIDNYQVLLPKELAIALVNRSHPLSWHKAAPKLFLVSVPAAPTRTSWRQAPEIPPDKWQADAGKEAFLYERVAWAFSSDAMSQIDNAIRISNLKPEQDAHSCSLSFDYDLQSCLDSNFAIIQEPGGLDLDGGFSDSRACHPDAIKVADLKGMTKRDRVQLDLAPNDDQVVPSDAPDSLALSEKELEEVVKELQKMARDLGGADDPWWLVTISASKELRFTAPGNTPVDLWGTLTYLGPALVFTFVNRAVCQAAADLTSLSPAVAPPGPGGAHPSQIRPTALGRGGQAVATIPSHVLKRLAFPRPAAYKAAAPATKPGHGKRRRAR
jgi:hypothetical protein